MPITPIGGVNLAPIKDLAYADNYAQQIYDSIYEAQNETLVKTQNQNFADKVLSRAKLKDSSETAYSAGNISGAVTLDYENGNYQYATLTGNVTSLTINNWPANGAGAWMTLELIQDGTGSRTLTLGSAYKTAGAAGVTLTTTASKRDKLYLQSRDAGTTIDVTATYNWS
jgi:hypothetical protein